MILTAYWLSAITLAVLIARWWLLSWCRKPPTADILGSEGVYVRRWHLVWNEKKLMLVIHRFMGPDRDPPHNHGGVGVSVVLGGRGIETYYRPDGSVLKIRRRRAGQVIFRTQKDIHRLDSGPSNPLTTLFLLLPQGIDWGFFTKDGFVPGKEYAKKYKADKRFKWINKPAEKTQ